MPDAAHIASGKVRELFALDDERLLLVASDRISTFDVVLPTEIPDKGRVLTGLSAYWFARTSQICANHLIEVREDGRSSECARLEMLPLECVVRGYLTGSGWKDYLRDGAVCGHELEPGLVESQRLPAPLFTPATKAVEGHDENIDAARAIEIVGEERFRELERVSIALYEFGAAHAAERGIIVADTKFELGLDREGRTRARGRGVDARFVAVLAGRHVCRRRPTTLLRQAVRARLLRVARRGTRILQALSCPTTSSRERVPGTSRRSSA